MSDTSFTRRAFLTDSGRAAAAGWVALQLPWLVALAGCATENTHQDAAFSHLTPPEARTIRAFAAQIIPSGDGTPGADEAGAVYFVDRALGMPMFESYAPVIREGVADLNARARDVSDQADFATLSSAQQQIAVMKAIEHTPFFAAARMLVIVGTFADSSYGGNRGGAGWKLVGMDHRSAYAAPFGWYDAQVATDSSPRAQ